jgi:hypothetical protein
LNDGDYRLSARAWTTATNVDTSPAEVVFTYDTVSPTATTLIWPTGGITVSASTVGLRWQPVSDSGSDLAYVLEVDGQTYTTTQSVYTITFATNGAHTWGVQVVDAAGNRSAWVNSTFSTSLLHTWLPVVMHNYGAQPPPSTDVIVNGGFESSGGWVLNRLAIYDTARVHTGAQSARVGIPPGEPGIYAYSSVSQTVTLPAGNSATLRLWVYSINEGNDTGDLHYVWLEDQWEGYEALDWTTTNQQTWVLREYDLSGRTGQTVTLFVGVVNDGDNDTAALYIDDVTLDVYP